MLAAETHLSCTPSLAGHIPTFVEHINRHGMMHYRKNVCLAVLLLCLGCIMLITGVSLFLKDDPESSGECSRNKLSCAFPGEQQQYNKVVVGFAGMALMILGSVAFLPGSYYSWIAYQAWRRREYAAELMAVH